MTQNLRAGLLLKEGPKRGRLDFSVRGDERSGGAGGAWGEGRGWYASDPGLNATGGRRNLGGGGAKDSLSGKEVRDYSGEDRSI